LNVNFNANLKLFLRLSNCASVGEENFDNYQDARYERKYCIPCSQQMSKGTFSESDESRTHHQKLLLKVPPISA